MKQLPFRVEVLPGGRVDVEAFLRLYLETVLDELRREGNSDDQPRTFHQAKDSP